MMKCWETLQKADLYELKSFTIYSIIWVIFKVQENGMEKSCVTHWEEEKCVWGCGWKNGTVLLEDLGIDDTIIYLI